MGRVMPKGVSSQVSRMVLRIEGVTSDQSSQMFTVWPRTSCTVRDFTPLEMHRKMHMVLLSI